MAKVIFITGASRGFGRLWAEAFLDRGDKVVVTSRTGKSLEELSSKYGDAVLALQLDISDRAACFAAIEKANSHFGSIDVVINNAAMGAVGMVEEISEKAAREMMEANFFGTLWVTQAALPVLRKQGSGHILQLSSALGVYTFPTLGIYSATKFAVEGISDALYQEVKGLGIYVTIVEPNGFATEFVSSVVQFDKISAYDEVRSVLYASPDMSGSDVNGDPKATVPAILKLVDSPEPPLRLFLGKKALPLASSVYQEKMATWEAWNQVSVQAHGL